MLTFSLSDYRIDNVGDYLYLNNGSFKFEFDPHRAVQAEIAPLSSISLQIEKKMLFFQQEILSMRRKKSRRMAMQISPGVGVELGY